MNLIIIEISIILKLNWVFLIKKWLIIQINYYSNLRLKKIG